MLKNSLDRPAGVIKNTVKNKGKSDVSFEAAQKIILNAVTPLSFETISIMEAPDRILYEDIVSDILIPPVDDSAMDGYAVIAADTLGASGKKPVRLRIVGEIKAGDTAGGKRVTAGTAVCIMTGAPIPEGADAVVRFEDTAEKNSIVRIFSEVSPRTNYRSAGENISCGDTVLQKGHRLNSADVGILASLNRHDVAVYRRPTVAVISTGDEIAELGEPMGPGQIRNVNAYTLCAEVRKYGGIPNYLGIVRDSPEEMKALFQKALECDVVLSTGGISMGKYDFVKEIFTALGIEIRFERVNIKPGSPFTFGKKDGKLFFGLPGNPVPTMTSFIQFVRPALLKLMGARKIAKPVVSAILEEDIKSTKVHHLVRGYFKIRDHEIHVSTTGNQKPSILRSMSAANCLIVIPEHIHQVKAGEKVTIQLIDHEEI